MKKIIHFPYNAINYIVNCLYFPGMLSYTFPFINQKGNVFYPTSLFQIQPKEFIKAKKLARPITWSEFETDPDEWVKICGEDKGVRLLEGGKKLKQKGYDYYDDELLKFIGNEWQKVAKLFQQYYSKVKETTGDAYLLWRLKQLFEEGKVEMQGNTQNMKEFEVKLAGVVNMEVAVAAEQTELKVKLDKNCSILGK